MRKERAFICAPESDAMPGRFDWHTTPNVVRTQSRRRVARPAAAPATSANEIKTGLGSLGVDMDDATLGRIAKLGGSAALSSIASLMRHIDSEEQPKSKAQRKAPPSRTRSAPEPVLEVGDDTPRRPAGVRCGHAFEREGEPGAAAPSDRADRRAAAARSVGCDAAGAAGAAGVAGAAGDERAGASAPDEPENRSQAANAPVPPPGEDSVREAAAPPSASYCATQNYRNRSQRVGQALAPPAGDAATSSGNPHSSLDQERCKKAAHVERKQRAAQEQLLARLAKVQRESWPKWQAEFRKSDPKGLGHVNPLQLRRALRGLVGQIGDGDFARLAQRLQREQEFAGAARFDYRAQVPAPPSPRKQAPGSTAAADAIATSAGTCSAVGEDAQTDQAAGPAEAANAAAHADAQRAVTNALRKVRDLGPAEHSRFLEASKVPATSSGEDPAVVPASHLRAGLLALGIPLSDQDHELLVSDELVDANAFVREFFATKESTPLTMPSHAKPVPAAEQRSVPHFDRGVAPYLNDGEQAAKEGPGDQTRPDATVCRRIRTAIADSAECGNGNGNEDALLKRAHAAFFTSRGGPRLMDRQELAKQLHGLGVRPSEEDIRVLMRSASHSRADKSDAVLRGDHVMKWLQLTPRDLEHTGSAIKGMHSGKEAVQRAVGSCFVHTSNESAARLSCEPAADAFRRVGLPGAGNVSRDDLLIGLSKLGVQVGTNDLHDFIDNTGCARGDAVDAQQFVTQLDILNQAALRTGIPATAAVSGADCCSPPSEHAMSRGSEDACRSVRQHTFQSQAKMQLAASPALRFGAHLPNDSSTFCSGLLDTAADKAPGSPGDSSTSPSTRNVLNHLQVIDKIRARTGNKGGLRKVFLSLERDGSAPSHDGTVALASIEKSLRSESSGAGGTSANITDWMALHKLEDGGRINFSQFTQLMQPNVMGMDSQSLALLQAAPPTKRVQAGLLASSGAAGATSVKLAENANIRVLPHAFAAGAGGGTLSPHGAALSGTPSRDTAAPQQVPSSRSKSTSESMRSVLADAPSVPRNLDPRQDQLSTFGPGSARRRPPAASQRSQAMGSPTPPPTPHDSALLRKFTAVAAPPATQPTQPTQQIRARQSTAAEVMHGSTRAPLHSRRPPTIRKGTQSSIFNDPQYPQARPKSAASPSRKGAIMYRNALTNVKLSSEGVL